MSTRTSGGPVPIISQAAGFTASSHKPHNDSVSDAGQETKGNDIRVQLHYLKDDPLYESKPPLQIVPEWRDFDGLSNVRLEAGPKEIIHDVRGRENTFSLDERGFKYVHAPTAFKDWSSQPEIAKVHLPELENLLRREVEGADEILFYDARLRQETEEGVKVSGLSYKPFARQVHTDNTKPSVIDKIHNLTDMKADYYMEGRVRIINIWRPIKHPVYDCGLAVANGAKLREGDVIECSRHRADNGRYWDTMGVVKHREGFEWHYMSLQDESDVLLFKNYDSSTDVKATHCLHTAFDVPRDQIPPDAPTRESIEVRALVFTLPKHVRRPSTLGILQHPLATHLEQDLMPLVDDDHCITDHLRTDIDEGGEMKDAMLMLRRKEKQRLLRMYAELKDLAGQSIASKEALSADLEAAERQIGIQSNHAAGLHLRIEALGQQLMQRVDEVTALQEEKAGWRTERQLLFERIDGQQHEIAKWKGEAMGRGNVAVSTVWQGSVDEAVRREREKDAFVISSRDAEIAKLREEVKRLNLLRVE